MAIAVSHAQQQSHGAVTEIEEITHVQTKNGETSTYVKRTHFAFLFKDTSVHVAEVQSVPELSERELNSINKELQKYVRNVFVVLTIVMAIAISFACSFEFSQARDSIRSNQDYLICFGVFFLIFPVIALIIREMITPGSNNTNTILKWICLVSCHLMFVLLMAGLACVDATRIFILTLLGLICFIFMVLMAFGFQYKHIYTTCHGMMLVFCVSVVLAIFIIPAVWYEAGSEQGKVVLGAWFAATFFCLFAIYDVIRLGDGDKSCLNSLKKPSDRDFLWDSVHMFLEFIVLCIIISLCALFVAIVLVCCIWKISDGGPTKPLQLRKQSPDQMLLGQT